MLSSLKSLHGFFHTHNSYNFLLDLKIITKWKVYSLLKFTQKQQSALKTNPKHIWGNLLEKLNILKKISESEATRSGDLKWDIYIYTNSNEFWGNDFFTKFIWIAVTADTK